MVIGIDCSRAFVKARTGTESYSYHLVREILRLPASRKHSFVLFIRPKMIIPSWVTKHKNVRVTEIKLRYLWTQIGLAVATWQRQAVTQCYSRFSSSAGSKKTGKLQNWKTEKRMLDVLWVPAHTLPVLRNPKVRTVVTIHGLEYEWLPEYQNVLQRWYLPLSTKYAAKYADKLIAVSKFTANQLVKQLHTSPKKIKVIHEGVETGVSAYRRVSVSESKRTLGKWGIVKGRYILFVGTLMPRKNLSALVEAFSLINQEYPDLKLVIAGSRGWMTEEIYQAPARYGVHESVIFAGRVSEGELDVLYQGARVYVQPSFTEGFGLPILEAMGRGVPVVSSNGGALPEVVADAGSVVELGPGYVPRLAAAIRRVLSDGKLRKRLIKDGKIRVGELSWEKASDSTLKILANVSS